MSKTSRSQDFWRLPLIFAFSATAVLAILLFGTYSDGTFILTDEHEQQRMWIIGLAIIGSFVFAAVVYQTVRLMNRRDEPPLDGR